MHGARTESAVNAASSSGGEAKKSVSWGMVKTHKVYVAEANSRVSWSTAACSAIFVSSYC